jgi:hypothetical protein
VTRTASNKVDIAPHLVRCNVNITSAQDEALTREAKTLGIGRNELLRRVLDEWREGLPKKGTT